MTISVGVGRHHAVDARRCDGGWVRRSPEAYRCFSPPVDDLAAYDELGTTPRRGSGPGLPAGRRGRPADPDRLGAAAPAGGLWRRLQADLPGDEPPDNARGVAPAGARSRLRRRPAAGRRRGGATRCGGRSHAAAGLLGPCCLDQPPDRRPGQIFAVAGRHRSGPGPAGGRGPAAVSGSRRQRRPTLSSRAITPGRATRCRASRSCCTTALRASPGGARRLLLDRPRRDRPLLPAIRPAADRGHRSPRRLGDSPAWSRWPQRARRPRAPRPHS